ncbi:phthiocerol synthesis polyketide synthase type IPpsB [Striga asiatica]|uniref:Phthiocerol synthesis polyketide synthase type IPpsB n=1 Tax=Striga asiatica TaxID=4170 RepID=A0A5A7NXL4_STRAF|nr:phthiocerol synthesis polyketide synthase type IPpsB [Striga asiatica]
MGGRRTTVARRRSLRLAVNKLWMARRRCGDDEKAMKLRSIPPLASCSIFCLNPPKAGCEEQWWRWCAACRNGVVRTGLHCWECASAPGGIRLRAVACDWRGWLPTAAAIFGGCRRQQTAVDMAGI